MSLVFRNFTERYTTCLVFGLIAGLASVSNAYADCKELGDDLHVKQIYGQLVMVGFKGTSLDEETVKEARSALHRGLANGLIFFSRNIRSARQVSKLTQAFLTANSKFKPFLAVDEEGGWVQRLKKKNGFANQPSAKTVEKAGLRKARTVYGQIAEELRTAGLNFNFGPVLDLDDRRNPIIGRLGRSFSTSPKVVAAFAGEFVDAHRRRGILTAVKHFPGHGSSRTDSHTQLVDVTPYWDTKELVPYQLLIERNKTDAVMSAHLVNEKYWSDSGEPASLSEPAVRGILRQDFGYDGVVITDDLQMEGIASRHDLKRAIVLALRAGNDIVLIGNRLKYQPNASMFAVDAIAEAVKKGVLNLEKLKRSFCRIVNLKSRI